MRIYKNDFKTSHKDNKEESYYDLIDDYDLIESSFLQQYGIRLRITDDMSWDEYSTLLCGLSPETPLGNIIRIRSEKDPKVISEFNDAQKKVYKEWNHKKLSNLDSLFSFFKN